MIEGIKIAIYLLCFATSLVCTFLLLRGFRGTGARLLLWSGLCFGFLALNSFMVVLDILIFPDMTFRVLRHLASLGAVGVLLFGLVWDLD